MNKTTAFAAALLAAGAAQAKSHYGVYAHAFTYYAKVHCEYGAAVTGSAQAADAAASCFHAFLALNHTEDDDASDGLDPDYYAFAGAHFALAFESAAAAAAETGNPYLATAAALCARGEAVCRLAFEEEALYGAQVFCNYTFSALVPDSGGSYRQRLDVPAGYRTVQSLREGGYTTATNAEPLVIFSAGPSSYDFYRVHTIDGRRVDFGEFYAALGNDGRYPRVAKVTYHPLTNVVLAVDLVSLYL